MTISTWVFIVSESIGRPQKWLSELLPASLIPVRWNRRVPNIADEEPWRNSSQAARNNFLDCLYPSVTN